MNTQLRGDRRQDTHQQLDAMFVSLGPAPKIGPIIVGIKEDTLARFAIATGASYLLIIGGEATRRVEMDDKTNIRLVDTHAKSNSGDDYTRFVCHKAVLDATPLLQTGMIGF